MDFIAAVARIGLAGQHVASFQERKKACSARNGKMGMGGFFTPPQCYVDGKKVDLVVSGGTKKKTRKFRTSKKRKSRISKKKRKSRTSKKR